jgi:hypothetical protein
VIVLVLVVHFARFVGLVVLVMGLWFSAGGMRVVVSGRLDERRRASGSLRRGIPLVVVGLLMLVGGTWILNWIRA